MTMFQLYTFQLYWILCWLDVSLSSVLAPLSSGIKAGGMLLGVVGGAVIIALGALVTSISI